MGIKIFGPDLKQIEDIGKRIEMITQGVPGTRSVYAERVSGGYFLDFDIKREEIARYGLTVMDIGQIIESAIGGESIATTIEGRERYPINVRYLRELRDDLTSCGVSWSPPRRGPRSPWGSSPRCGCVPVRR